MIELASTVLFSHHPEAVISFYRALGVPLETEDHGDGIGHAAADIAGVHFAIYGVSAGEPAPVWRIGGSSFVGFYVDSLDVTLAALKVLGAKLLTSHQHRDWGCRIVVEDPDGRAVEVNQRDHCRGDDSLA